MGLSCNGQGKVLLSALRSEGRRAGARSNVTERLRTLACAADPTSQRMRVEDAFPAAQGRASSSSVANAPVSFATSKRFARGFRRACFVFDAGFSDQKAVFWGPLHPPGPPGTGDGGGRGVLSLGAAAAGLCVLGLLLKGGGRWGRRGRQRGVCSGSSDGEATGRQRREEVAGPSAPAVADGVTGQLRGEGLGAQ